MIDKLNVDINYDENFIEITKEGSNATLHLIGVKQDPRELGKAIGNYLLEVTTKEAE